MLYRPVPPISGFAPGAGPELQVNAEGLFDFQPNGTILEAFAAHGIKLEEVGPSAVPPSAAELELATLREQLAEAQAATARAEREAAAAREQAAAVATTKAPAKAAAAKEAAAAAPNAAAAA
jgi:hypothetical protein